MPISVSIVEDNEQLRATLARILGKLQTQTHFQAISRNRSGPLPGRVQLPMPPSRHQSQQGDFSLALVGDLPRRRQGYFRITGRQRAECSAELLKARYSVNRCNRFRWPPSRACRLSGGRRTHVRLGRRVGAAWWSEFRRFDSLGRLALRSH